jgi:hypothetical protein
MPGHLSPAERARRDQRRADHLRAAGDLLAAQARSITTAEDWRRHLELARLLHQTSGVTAWSTVLLIAAQRPDATAVAGYDAWLAAGRQVSKGEKGILVLAPTSAAPPDAYPVGTGARPTYVWDITQTAGPAQPPPRRRHPDPDQLLPGLAWVAASRGWTLTRGELDAAAHARSDPSTRTITVRADLGPAAAATALAHALGHLYLDDGSAAVCSGLAWIEAESVAYLVTGQASPAAFADIAMWAPDAGTGPAQLVERTGRRVLPAAHAILDTIDAARAASRQVVPAPARQVLAGRVAASAARTQQLRDRAAASCPRRPTSACPPLIWPGCAQRTPKPPASTETS